MGLWFSCWPFEPQLCDYRLPETVYAVSCRMALDSSGTAVTIVTLIIILSPCGHCSHHTLFLPGCAHSQQPPNLSSFLQGLGKFPTVNGFPGRCRSLCSLEETSRICPDGDVGSLPDSQDLGGDLSRHSVDLSKTPHLTSLSTLGLDQPFMSFGATAKSHQTKEPMVLLNRVR